MAVFRLAAASTVLSAQTARVLVVTGGHDHDPSFYGLFEGDPGIEATVNPHPNAYLKDFEKRFDVLVLYDMLVNLEEARQAHLRRFAESGKGIVILHHAIGDYENWQWWWEEVAGGRFLPSMTYIHGRHQKIHVVKQHPVTAGVRDFEIEDETYKGIHISPKNDVLLRSEDPTSDGPVAWVSSFAQSRVVCIQLGHERKAHQNPTYRKLVTNAITWSGQQPR